MVQIWIINEEFGRLVPHSAYLCFAGGDGSRLVVLFGLVMGGEVRNELMSCPRDAVDADRLPDARMMDSATWDTGAVPSAHGASTTCSRRIF
eukprot:7645723-Pyramimonas_sp.AAC.1